MKHLKKGILAVIVSAAVLLTVAYGILSFVQIGLTEQEQGGDTQLDNVSLDGLPDWITLEMVSAAIQMMEETGYPASVVLGQMILESGAGGSELSNPPYYNCLGLKSPSYGETGSVTMNTAEAWGYEDAGFSTFSSYLDCMRAWGHRFTMAPYVDNVTACQRDPTTGHYDANAFIEAIWRSGYATDPEYVDKVITVMTTYDLYRFNNISLIQEWGPGTGNYDGTVTPTMQRIVEVARNNQGTYPCTPDMCAAWVTGVYQAAGSSVVPYGDAIDMWNRYQMTGSTSRENIPPGAIVCGSGFGDAGARYGHVGIYLGDGLVANNRGYFSIETLESWCGWQTANCQGHVGWIGWVYPGE